MFATAMAVERLRCNWKARTLLSGDEGGKLDLALTLLPGSGIGIPLLAQKLQSGGVPRKLGLFVISPWTRMACRVLLLMS